MTELHNTEWMIVRSADQSKKDSFKKVLNEIEGDMSVGRYDLKSVIECKGEIFFFLINEEGVRETRGPG
jgi:hypothetical protein